MVTDGAPPPQKKWRIKVSAKCGSFNIQIQATELIPVLPNFSVVLRIRRFILKLESDCGSVILKNQYRKRDFSSRIRVMLGKIRLPQLLQKKKTKNIKIGSLPHPLMKQIPYCELQELIGSSRLYLKVLFVFIVFVFLEQYYLRHHLHPFWV